MRISVRHNSSYLLEFDQLIVRGHQAAGGYAFSFTLRGGGRACSPTVNIFDINLSVSLSVPEWPLLTAVPSLNQVVRCANYPSNSEQLNFEFVLSKEQINAIEEYRKEGNLKLNIGLRTLVGSAEGLRSTYDRSDVEVSREHWLGALERAGFRKTLFFEVPFPAVSDDIETVFEKAQEFIEIGHYKDAVMQCRHLIERIEKIRGDKSEASKANARAHGTERKDMSSIERLLSLREQLKNICQLGAHGSEYFTRSQARVVLAMTMALAAEPTVGFTASIGEGSYMDNAE